MTTQRQMIEIAGDQLSAAINPYGAELTHLRDAGGRNLMTDADPAFWTGHAPILFPVIGVTNGGVVRIGGREYPMAKHGFARHSLFDVVETGPARAVFALADSEATRASYPFAFRLEIGFAIADATITLEARIENRGDGPLPAQFGFHPAFAWPLPYGEDRGAHRVTFERHEPGELRGIAPDGLIAPDYRASPLSGALSGRPDGGRELLLADALFANDALVWDPIRSQSVTYGAAQGPVLHVRFPDTPRLGIWTKPALPDGEGPRFVCIEPWHGIADPEGFAGDFTQKPGVFEIAPGDEKRIGMSVTLVGA
ncbi:aldose 1-epimerase family protein [Sphingomonas bacterium]|uniref:aldose 1-epimerase family protein n=1 Tax=Sphingomonas bacterium TaxID=1895847 RepID=UPI0020C69D18|nr:aldose 1-epimerase family protein [Sphingomonas bacterium]